ncbi:alpha/beta fold hydrolase [uncultured Nostoc sp.]|uniref:alpha/beta fold hydrolase n=1 Tax=uncultured Nostoc sp. TaxID=340711 RepID=UPI0035CC8723
MPGILGSVLQKNGSDIWNISLQVATRATREIFTRRSLLEELIIIEDDPERDYLDDGIKATGLIQDATLVPGFFKVDGYLYLRNQLIKNFQVTLGKIDSHTPANFFEFAYDWRRDNRVSARLLKKLIDKKLLLWQETYPDAQVILIAHSMGGLVSRYYLEHLGGREHCKALITLSTPHRGSVKALNFLANGYQKRPLPALTDVLRSFTSAYQLLPMYPVMKNHENWQRVAETDGILGVDKERATEAREFLQLINEPNNQTTYEFKPIIGVGQKSTFQSASLTNGKLEVSNSTLPLNPNTQEPLDANYATGDDTVPLLSAIPIKLSKKLQDVPLIESHGVLQSNVQVWNLLQSYLMRLQNNIEDFQNPQTIQSGTQTAGISISVDDLYLPDEEVIMSAEIINVSSDILEHTRNFEGLSAIITLVDANAQQEKVIVSLQQTQDTQYQLILNPNKLAPGLYCLQVETNRSHDQAPKAVHNLFQVMG